MAPSPQPTEHLSTQAGRLFSKGELSSLDELNALLQSPEGQQAIEDAAPDSLLQQAQDVAYAAWEAEIPERYALARQALAIDSRCSDAWLILAEEEHNWRKQRRFFENAGAAAEQARREAGLFGDWESNHEGSVYMLASARSYLRAKMALARCLMDGGYFAEAIRLYDKLIELDPDDHMGARYEVVQLYHAANDLDALARILDRFGDDELAFLAYERIWLALVRGDEVAAEGLLEKALKANEHVPEILLDSGPSDPSDDGFITVGGESEAAEYAAAARRWWREVEYALDWLEEHTDY